MGSLKLYPLGKVYAVFEGSRNHFVVVYNDMSVGSIRFAYNRPTNGWEWSFHDSRPQYDWRRGFAPTYEDAKREAPPHSACGSSARASRSLTRAAKALPRRSLRRKKKALT
jgi:hypothetical protein